MKKSKVNSKRIRKTLMEPKDKILSKFAISKTKSLKKRKNAILMEYKNLGKSNKVIDKRIGENNKEMTEDQRHTARFMAHKMKTQSNKSFEFDQLGKEPTQLTHKGRTLLEIERFDDPVSESDEEDGRISSDIVKNEHFGGGLFTKASNENGPTGMERIIMESKMRKAQQQQEKEENIDLTEQLDEELKKILPMIDQMKKSDKITKSRNIDSYDKLLGDIKFAAVARPSELTKTEDEIVAEERKKFEKFEQERLERMKRNFDTCADDDENNEPRPKKHISGDDLNDGFDIDEFLGDVEHYEENEDSIDEEGESVINDKIECDEDVGKIEGIILKECKTAAIVPQSLNDLLLELSNKTVNEKAEYIVYLVKKQKMHTGVSVKNELNCFFRVLLDYVDTLFNNKVCKESWEILDTVCPVLFELAQSDCEIIANIVFEKLKSKRDTYKESVKRIIPLDTLILLKIIPLLFPTSDFYHPVVTPTMVFISQLFSENLCKTMDSVIKGLYLSTIFLEYVHFSKRFNPQLLNFLRSVLCISIPNFVGSSPPISNKNKLLVIAKPQKYKNLSVNDMRLDFSLLSNAVDDKKSLRLKPSIMYTTVNIISAYFNLYNNFTTSNIIWKSLRECLHQLPICNYPEPVQEKINDLISTIDKSPIKSLNYLIGEKKRPKMLRQFEPKFKDITDKKSSKMQSTNKAESQKLNRQYKKEYRGAMKEIRKDSSVLNTYREKEQKKKDIERKKKTDLINQSGQQQQAEYNKMKRMNLYRH